MTWRPARSLRGQVLLVLLLSLAAAQGFTLWLFADERDLAVRAALAQEAIDRAVNVAQLLETTPRATHPAILRAANSPLVRFSLDPAPTLNHDHHNSGHGLSAHIRRTLAAAGARKVRVDLHENIKVMRPMPGMPEDMRRVMARRNMRLATLELRISAQLADIGWLNVVTRFHRPPLQWAWAEIASFILSALVLIVALWLILGRIVRPLARLSDATDRLGRGEAVPEIPATGPEELRRLTIAFNRMQARIRRFVDERTRLVSALGHDLRSPLTAMRVRAEMVEEDETRAGLVASVEEMSEMVEATLDFARGAATAEPVETVDLGDFTQALAADYADTGRDVTAEGMAPGLLTRLPPGPARRALRNVIDNALRYGGAARLSAEAGAEELRLFIDDDGPGVPEAELERVFEPFLRLETSRSRETGGAGLGLALARTILRAHGGDIRLSNRSPRGLRATIALPRAPRGKSEENPKGD